MNQTIRQRSALRMIPRKSPVFAPRINSRTSFLRGFRAIGWIVAVLIIAVVALGLILPRLAAVVGIGS